MRCGHYAGPIAVLKILTKVIGSSAALYSIWELFRRRIWRWRVFRWLGLVNFPDINGRWTGTLNWKRRKTNIPASITIRQTYTDITVAYFGVMSVSHSIAASLAITGEEDDHPNFCLRRASHLLHYSTTLSYKGRPSWSTDMQSGRWHSGSERHHFPRRKPGHLHRPRSRGRAVHDHQRRDWRIRRQFRQIIVSVGVRLAGTVSV